jgi:uncharacterized protein (DUF305 family)
MNKNTILAVVIGLVFGVGATIGISSITKINDPKGSIGVQERSTVTNHHDMSMSDMTKELKNLSGDDFDKAFIEMMIAHHEGAVDMANLSQSRAKHEEIKQLSNDIISAQNNEITDMKRWQKEWGYASDESKKMMHGNH